MKVVWLISELAHETTRWTRIFVHAGNSCKHTTQKFDEAHIPYFRKKT